MPYDIRFHQGSSFLICGPSESGKTTFVYNVIANKSLLFDDPPKYVFLFFKHKQQMYHNMLQSGLLTKAFEGYSSYETIESTVMPFRDKGGSAVILDDQLGGISTDIQRIFTELCHQGNASIFYISQNLFFANPKYRTISLNAHYVILMKNPRDKTQIANFAKQFSGGKTKYVVESFQNATKNPYSYLLFDFKQTTPDILRLRTNFLPNEITLDNPITIYIEKNTII